MGKQFIIDEELANNILDYLDEQKYKEVYALCDGLRKLKEYVDVKP
jgi:hypothetical protein